MGLLADKLKNWLLEPTWEGFCSELPCTDTPGCRSELQTAATLSALCID